MRLDIRAQGIEIEDTFREHAGKRLQFALGRFRHKISAVVVRVGDHNGPKGGIDKRCHISVHLAPSGSVFVEDSDPDLNVALSRAAGRVSRSVSRVLARRNDFDMAGVERFDMASTAG